MNDQGTQTESEFVFRRLTETFKVFGTELDGQLVAAHPRRRPARRHRVRRLDVHQGLAHRSLVLGRAARRHPHPRLPAPRRSCSSCRPGRGTSGSRSARASSSSIDVSDSMAQISDDARRPAGKPVDAARQGHGLPVRREDRLHQGDCSTRTRSTSTASATGSTRSRSCWTKGDERRADPDPQGRPGQTAASRQVERQRLAERRLAGVRRLRLQAVAAPRPVRRRGRQGEGAPRPGTAGRRRQRRLGHEVARRRRRAATSRTTCPRTTRPPSTRTATSCWPASTSPGPSAPRPTSPTRCCPSSTARPGTWSRGSSSSPTARATSAAAVGAARPRESGPSARTIPIFTVAVGSRAQERRRPHHRRPGPRPDAAGRAVQGHRRAGRRRAGRPEGADLPRDPAARRTRRTVRIPTEATYAPGEPPHAQAEFVIDPRDRLPEALTNKENPKELVEGEWKVRAVTPRVEGERFADKEHVSDWVTIKVQKKPARVLVVCSAPNRDVQFLITQLLRDKADISLFVQNEGGQDGQDQPARRAGTAAHPLPGPAGRRRDPERGPDDEVVQPRPVRRDHLVRPRLEPAHRRADADGAGRGSICRPAGCCSSPGTSSPSTWPGRPTTTSSGRSSTSCRCCPGDPDLAAAKRTATQPWRLEFENLGGDLDFMKLDDDAPEGRDGLGNVLHRPRGAGRQGPDAPRLLTTISRSAT